MPLRFFVDLGKSAHSVLSISMISFRFFSARDSGAVPRAFVCKTGIFTNGDKPGWNIGCLAELDSPDTSCSRRVARRNRCSPFALDAAWKRDLLRAPLWRDFPPQPEPLRWPAATSDHLACCLSREPWSLLVELGTPVQVSSSSGIWRWKNKALNKLR